MIGLEDLRPAAFRGVAFQVVDADAEGGRRLVDREFPQRDEGSNEDLGRRKRRYRVRAFVIGDDYGKARNALQDALEARGPGLLMHPFLGQLRVEVESYRLSEQIRKLAMAEFEIQFLEAGARERAYPVANPDTAERARQRAAALYASAEAQAAATVKVAKKPASLLSRLSRQIDSLAAGIRETMQNILPGSPLDWEIVRSIDNLTGSVSGAFTDVIGLAGDFVTLYKRFPGVLIGRFQGLAALFAEDSSEGRSVQSRARSRAVTAVLATPRAAIDTPIAAPATPTQGQAEANRVAIVRLSSQVAIAAAAEIAAGTGFDSYDQAIEIRDALVEAIETELLEADGDTVIRDLVALEQAVIADVTARGGSLARLESLAVRATTTALLVSHRRFGVRGGADIEAHAVDLVARNAIGHPGQVLPGLLEILSNA